MFAEAFDEEDDDEGSATGADGKKKGRSWLGKIGKGMYRRTVNLGIAAGVVDAPMSKEDEVCVRHATTC